MDNPTKIETPQQNTARSDVSYGANSNLSAADVAETGAAEVIEAQHQSSGEETANDTQAALNGESDAARQMDNSGMLSPEGQQPQETTEAARMGQSGSARNRQS